MTTDCVDSPLNTARSTAITGTGVSTGNPTLAPPTWVDLFQIYFRFGAAYMTCQIVNRTSRLRETADKIRRAPWVFLTTLFTG